jgi:coenzyme F420-reducing hydrogenase beta subunit/polysaccharide pyruvyl transferase WcaK-like protein
VGNIERVVHLGLCVSCEICRAICPENAIVFRRKGGQYVPMVESSRCKGCGLCLEVCPGLRLDPHNLIKQNMTEETNIFGKCMECYAAKLRDSELLQTTASGGVTTGLLIELLEKRVYDFASVLEGVGSNTRLPRLQFTHDPKIIVDSARSKYVPASAYSLIKIIEKERSRRFIVTATPCVLDAIKAYGRARSLDMDRILFIGLFCELTMNLNFIEYINRKYGKRGEGIARIEYRHKSAGGWPGNMLVSFSDGRKVAIDKKERIGLKPYFQLKRCLYCTDKLNRAADISVGDCYVRYFEEDEGKSSIVIRTEKGVQAFNYCKESFSMDRLTLDQIWCSQDMGNIRERTKRLSQVNNGLRLNGMADTLFGGGLYSKNKLRKIEWGNVNKVNIIMFNLFATKIVKKFRILIRYLLRLLILIHRVLLDVLIVLLGLSNTRKCKGQEIAIIGANYTNRGAQSMALTVIDEIRRIKPDARIVLLLCDYEQEKSGWEEFNIDTMLWDGNTKSLLLCPRVLRSGLVRLLGISDALMRLENYRRLGKFLDISGYALSSQWEWRHSLSYIENIMIAVKLRARIDLLPQSFGPWDYPRFIKIFLYCLFFLYLRYPSNIYVREEEGKRHIQSLLIKPLVSPDIVLADRGNEHSSLKTFSNRERHVVNEASTGSIGIVPNIKILERMDSEEFFHIYDLVIQVLCENDLNIVFISYSDEDKQLCEKLSERAKDLGAFARIAKDLNSLEVENVVKQLRFLFASRYHSIVHAYKNGIPVVAFGWAEKYKELMNSFNQTKYLLDVKDNFADGIVKEKIEKMIENYPFEGTRISSSLELIPENSFIQEIVF